MIHWINKAKELPGDFAEIGLGIGETTVKLLQVAKQCGKHVYGVDPFEDGWNEMPESYGKPYRQSQFESNIKEYEDLFTLHGQNSLAASSEQFLCRPLALAYVDGLQYKGAVLSDLRIVSHAEIIIVDDYNRLSGISEVPLAVDQFIKKSKRTLTIIDRWAVLTK